MEINTTQTVNLSSLEVKQITGYEFVNSYGEFAFESDVYGIQPEMWETLEGAWVENSVYDRGVEEVEHKLRLYATKTFLGDAYKIMTKGKIHITTKNNNAEFFPDNDVIITFVVENEDYLEVDK